MLTDIFITNLLLKKKFSKNKILAFFITVYIVLYFLLAYIFKGIFSANSSILPAVIIFILFFLFRINNINNHIIKEQKKVSDS
jgi:fucose permease